jgi:hypothetical protein
MNISGLKMPVGAILIVSLGFGLLERLTLSKHVIVDSGAGHVEWIGWMAWIVGASASIAYIGIDVVDWLRSRRTKT